MQALTGLSGLSGIIFVSSNDLVGYAHVYPGGIAPVTVVYAQAATGGAVAAGSADVAAVRVITVSASGGAVAGGTADAGITRAATATGGSILSGVADVQLVSAGGGSTAGTPIGLLLALTRTTGTVTPPAAPSWDFSQPSNSMYAWWLIWG